MGPPHSISIAILVRFVLALEVKNNYMVLNREKCKNVGAAPYFDVDVVIGKPWRIYYTWDMQVDHRCLDMKFKNATPMITRRIWNDMNEYLETQPYWDAATLLVTMGRAAHEMLLFADQGPAGSFVGVPNVMREGNISPARNAVPLLKFHMKLLHGGKYLLMIDCNMGVSTLSARSNSRPYRTEIASIATSLHLGDGFPACYVDKNNDEELYIK